MSGNNILHPIAKRPWTALAIFLVVFFVLAAVLFLIDFVPEPAEGEAEAKKPDVTITVSDIKAGPKVQNVNLIAGPAPAVLHNEVGNVPTRIIIPKVGVDTTVANPASQSLSVLDEELLKGAVRYPGSATLGEEGSVVLFGHQSYLPIVHNKAFKAFNDVQKLKVGDVISVYSGATEYRYAVRTVQLVTTDIGTIALPTVGQTLTLVTCNSLGQKEERNIVTADFIGIYIH